MLPCQHTVPGVARIAVLRANGLGDLVVALARSTVVVSNDSGPLHLGVAVGASTVRIFWCLNLINAGPFLRARHRVVLGFGTLRPIRGRSTITEACDHAVSRVSDAAPDLLRQGRPGTRD
jgi:hypothetical protein